MGEVTPAGGTAGFDERVIRYRLDALRRFWPLIMLAIVPFWVAACMRTSDFAALPGALALLAIVVGAASYVQASRSVTLSPDALVDRSVFGTKRFTWAEIITVTRTGGGLAVSTETGCYVLALPGVARVPGTRSLGPGRPTLATDVWAAWLNHRGPSWEPRPFTPWQPDRDAAGRVVFRGSLLSRMAVCSAFFGVAVGQTIAPLHSLSTALWPNVVFAVMAAAIMSAYHWWAGVTVGPTHVVVRSIAVGWRRIPRGEVRVIEETLDTFPLITTRRVARLALGTRNQRFRLPAPENRLRWYAQDPEYHHKWLWLHDELVRRAAPIADRRDDSW